MIFFLGFSLGIAATALRSAIALAGIGTAIVVTFITAMMLSAGSLHMLPLLVAVAAYNAGIAACFAAMIGKRKFMAS